VIADSFSLLRSVRYSWLPIAVIVLVAHPAVAQDTRRVSGTPRFELELEAGPVWQSRNDVRIPNEGGTKFSYVRLLGSGPYPALRGYLKWNISRRHGLRLLVAPLTISGTGGLDEPVAFAGENFAAGEPTQVTYRFNSFRLTYLYRLFTGETWTWD